MINYKKFEFKKNRPPQKMLSIVDTFNDCECDDYIDSDYVDF